MDDRRLEAARARIRLGQQAAAGQARAAREDPVLTRQSLEGYLRQYILEKFLLADDPPDTDKLGVLARESLARSMSMAPGLAAIYDTSAGCSSASSVDTKLTLLLLAVQKDFRVRLDPARAVRAERVPELADMIWENLRKGL